MSTLTHAAATAVGEIDEVIGKLLDSISDVDKTEREILIFDALKMLRTTRNELALAPRIDATEVRT